MSKPDKLLQDYLEKMMALRTKRQEHLSTEDLQSVAVELGMSPQDLEEAKQVAQDHFTRGQGYLKHQRWNDAIKELSDAVSLSPLQIEYIQLLATAYLERWKYTDKKTDKDEARLLAQRCLELDPNHEASFLLLNTLDGKQIRQKVNPYPDISRQYKVGKGVTKQNKLIFILVNVVFFGGLVLYLSMSSSPDLDEQKASSLGSFPPPTPLVPGETSVSTGNNVTAAKGDISIPVSFENMANDTEFVLYTRKSQLNSYGKEPSFYKFQAEIAHKNDREVSKIKAEIKLFNKEGKVIGTDIKTILDTYEASLRKGDRHAFDFLEKTTSSLSKVLISIQSVSQEPAPKKFTPSKQIQPVWNFEKPMEIQLEFFERSSQFDVHSFNNSAYHTLVLECKNTGEGSIKNLKIQLIGLDKEGNMISSDERYIVSSATEPSLLPAQARLVKYIVETKPSFDHYQVKILKAK